MNITTITLLDAGISEQGKPWAKVEWKPLVGDAKAATVVFLNLGDTITTDAPVVESLVADVGWPEIIGDTET